MRGSKLCQLLVPVMLAMGVFGVPPARKIIQASSSSISSAKKLPFRSITIDHTHRAWEGKNWHYSVPDPVSGKLEAFSIFIVDGDSSDAEPVRSRHTSVRRNTIIEPAQAKRDLWVCTWAYGCGDNPVGYAAAVTASQALAVGNAINDRLRANTNDLMKKMFDGQVVGMSIAINTGTDLFYITNKMLHRKNDVDICVTNGDWTQTVNYLKADVDHLATLSQGGDFFPKTYDHYSHEEVGPAEGKHLLHALKISTNSSSFNPLEC
jgi:hypothetical protein